MYAPSSLSDLADYTRRGVFWRKRFAAWMPSMSNFREFDRETGFLLPPSLDEWLPEQHLARWVGPVGDGEELSGHRLGWLSSGLCWGCWFTAMRPFEPQAGAGDL